MTSGTSFRMRGLANSEGRIERLPYLRRIRGKLEIEPPDPMSATDELHGHFASGVFMAAIEYHELRKIERKLSSNLLNIKYPEYMIPTKMASLIRSRFIAPFCTKFPIRSPLGRLLDTPLHFS